MKIDSHQVSTQKKNWKTVFKIQLKSLAKQKKIIYAVNFGENYEI